MKIWSRAANAFGVTAAIALLVGCNGGSQSAPGTTGMTPTSATQWRGKALSPMLAMRMTNAAGLAPVTHPNHRKSWMSPEAKRRRPLLYTSNYVFSDVIVYAFDGGRTGKAVGELTGFMTPYGECSDSVGDVWIVDFTAEEAFEYAHGATTPTKTLSTGGESIGCSVDPTTGNLAVTNFAGPGSVGYGSVAVFADASGSPTDYTVADTDFWPAGYDNKGNLFVTGENEDTFANQLYELPSGGTSLEAITESGFSVSFPAADEWDGKYLAVGDQLYEGMSEAGVYRVTVASGTATEVSETEYTDDCDEAYNDVVQPAIHAGKFVAGNMDCHTTSVDRIDYWNYANGGNPIRYIDGADYKNASFGQTVSK
jgi:hypothetical protein